MADGEITRQAFQVAYIGDSKDDHTMDVEVLAPALLGFGKLIRAANAQLNGDKATVKVFVASDFEHKCFNIKFEVVQTIWKQIKDFLDGDKVQDATALLKQIGVLGGLATGAMASLLKYLQWRKGRKVQSAEPVKGSSDQMLVKVEGDNNQVTINKNTFLIASNKEVLEAVQATLSPIKERHEAEAVEFRQDDQTVELIQRDQADAIVATCETDIKALRTTETDEEERPKTVTATLYVYGPVFDAKAPNWRFLYRKKPIYADVRDTNIAKDAVKRGGSFTNDRYRVKMQVTPPTTNGGDPHYKIIEVTEFTPAEQQASLPLRKPRRAAPKKAKKQPAS